MNDLFLNTTWFTVTSIFIYLVVIIYALYRISTRFRVTVSGITEKLLKQANIAKVIKHLQDYLIIPLKAFSSRITGYLGNTGSSISGTEGIFTKKIKPFITEPVNITALVLRKLYNESIVAVIGVSAGIIVVFYIILTIF